MPCTFHVPEAVSAMLLSGVQLGEHDGFNEHFGEWSSPTMFPSDGNELVVTVIGADVDTQTVVSFQVSHYIE